MIWGYPYFWKHPYDSQYLWIYGVFAMCRWELDFQGVARNWSFWPMLAPSNDNSMTPISEKKDPESPKQPASSFTTCQKYLIAHSKWMYSQTTFDRSLWHILIPLILQFVLTSSIFSACLQRWCPLQVHVSLGSKGWVPAWCYLWHQWCWYITSPDRWNQPQQIGWEVLVPPWSWADRLGGIRIPNVSWDDLTTRRCVYQLVFFSRLCL